MRPGEWERLRTGIALKTFTALMKRYQHMSAAEEAKKLREARRFAKVWRGGCGVHGFDKIWGTDAAQLRCCTAHGVGHECLCAPCAEKHAARVSRGGQAAVGRRDALPRCREAARRPLGCTVCGTQPAACDGMMCRVAVQSVCNSTGNH
jgi:hypothetical protein